MSSDIRVESPLHYLHKLSSHSISGGTELFNADAEFALVVKERRDCSFLNLRGSSGDKMFRSAIASIVGVQLPTEPGHYHNNADHSLYWLGPDAWLLSSNLDAADLEMQLRADMTGHISIVDVSGGYTAINLRGLEYAVHNVLKKSTVYDFVAWPDASASNGRCAQTNFAKTSALISNKLDGSYDVIIRRSFSDYVGQWLLDAGKEFGCRIED